VVLRFRVGHRDWEQSINEELAIASGSIKPIIEILLSKAKK